MDVDVQIPRPLAGAPPKMEVGRKYNRYTYLLKRVILALLPYTQYINTDMCRGVC